MKKILSEKVALVTGGTRGIGKAIAQQFVKEGAHVALFGTNPTIGNESVAFLQKSAEAGQKIHFYQVDVGNLQSVDTAIAQVLQDFGKIDILINNAGVTKDNLLMKLTEEEWDKVMTTNLKSIYNTCRAVIRPMMRSRQGKIINITSVVGLTGNAGQTNYAASKAGMIGFTKSLAKEVASRNIQINCIAPGFIETAMTDAIPEEKKSAFLSSIPLQRFGRPEEIAYAAVYLASNMADYVTGQVITVDGGMVM